MHRLLLFPAFLALSSSLPSQVGPGHLVVATRLPGNPATRLLDVDPITGQIVSLGRFPADGLPPLGVRLDPTNGNLVVALDAGGATQIVRLQMRGTAFTAEQTLATLPGPLTDMALLLEADTFATVGGAQGGVFRIPRRGGTATRVAVLPRASALASGFRHLAGQVLVLQDGLAGPPVVDPQVSEVDLTNGSIGQVVQYTGYTPRQLTGIVDFPTAVVQQLIGNPDGTVAMSTFYNPPMVLPVQPVLPAGAVTALHEDMPDFGAMALGDSNHPFLNRLDPFSAGGPAWQQVAGPLPGSPVDFDVDPGPRAQMHFFGASCAGTLQATSIGGPVLGTSFSFTMRRGLPNASALVAMGLSEIGGFGLPPRILLPGGCLLLVTPDAVSFHTTDNFGGAMQSIPVPNNPVFLGIYVYAQWFQPVGGSLAATAGIAARVGT